MSRESSRCFTNIERDAGFSAPVSLRANPFYFGRIALFARREMVSPTSAARLDARTTLGKGAMMQRTRGGAVVRRALIIDSGLAGGGAAGSGVRALCRRARQPEHRGRRIRFVRRRHRDGHRSDSSIHCILLNWTQGGNEQGAIARQPSCCGPCATRNAKIPMFLMASRSVSGTLSVEVDDAGRRIHLDPRRHRDLHQRSRAGRDRAIRAGAVAAYMAASYVTTARRSIRGPRPVTRAASRS